MISRLKLTLILISIITSQVATASCFREHVKEGRALNHERKDLYAEWAQGHDLKSRAKLVSNALMSLETVMLPMARIYDYKARKHEATGLFCDDFIPIADTPEFNTIYAQIPRGSFIKNLAFISTYERDVKRALSSKNWARVRELSLIAIDSFPALETHCLTRHFIESLGRIAALAPRHIRLAQESNLKDPSDLIASMIKFHLVGLGYSQKIDSLAAPLQYKGIPIVCNDVPFVPIPELTR